MSVIELQIVLNNWGIKDDRGNRLDLDGIRGNCTNQAIAKAKRMINTIMK